MGAFSQGTEDPFSFPKAEGANAIVDLGVTGQDKKEKVEGRRASVWRHNQGAQGERGLASGACQGAKMEVKMMGRWASPEGEPPGQRAAWPPSPGSMAPFSETLDKLSSQSLRSSSIK